jgi:hypothetical protein
VLLSRIRSELTAARLNDDPPSRLKRRQPAFGSLPIITIVVPAISRKGAKNQLRRERGVPALLLYLRNGTEKGRTGVGPNSAGVSRRRSNESRVFFVAWAARPNHDAPHWPGRFLSNLEA